MAIRPTQGARSAFHRSKASRSSHPSRTRWASSPISCNERGKASPAPASQKATGARCCSIRTHGRCSARRSRASSQASSACSRRGIPRNRSASCSSRRKYQESTRLRELRVRASCRTRWSSHMKAPTPTPLHPVSSPAQTFDELEAIRVRLEDAQHAESEAIRKLDELTRRAESDKAAFDKLFAEVRETRR